MENALLISVINEVILHLENENYISPSGASLLGNKKISKRRIRKLKRRLKRISRSDYEKYKKLINILEYHLLLQVILD